MSSIPDSDDFFAMMGRAAMEPAPPPFRKTSWSDIDAATRSFVITDHLDNPDIAFSPTTGYLYPPINLESTNGGLEITHTSMVSQSAVNSSLAIRLNEFDAVSNPTVGTSFADGAFDYHDGIFNNLLPHLNYSWENTFQSNSDPGRSVDFTSTLMSPSVISDGDWFTPSPQITPSDISKTVLSLTLPASIDIRLNLILPSSPLSLQMDGPEFHRAEDGITLRSFFPMQQVQNPSMYVLRLRCEGISLFQFDHDVSYIHSCDAPATSATTRPSCIHATCY